MKFVSFHDVLAEEIKDLYSAESQIIEALPKVVDVTTSVQLGEALDKHYTQTLEHRNRLEQIGKLLNIDVDGKKCKGVEGMIKETEEALNHGSSIVLDAVIMGGILRVEHYEMAGYQYAIMLAKIMEHKDTEKLLKETLNEEMEAEKVVTKIAQSDIKNNINIE